MMEVYQWLCLFGIPSIISGIVALILSRGMKKRDQKQEQIRIQNDIMEKQNKAIMAGVQAILRDRLLQGYKIFLAKGWADYEDRANLENIWKQYHALGANGVMNDMRKQFRQLPVYEGGPRIQIEEEEEGT